MSGAYVKMSVSINGINELRKELEELGGDFKKAIRSGARAAAKKIAKEANDEAKARGWSEESYFGVKETRASKKSDTFVGIKIESLSMKNVGWAPQKNRVEWYKKQGDRFYVLFTEYGTIKQAPQPLLRPIFARNEGYINFCIREAINKASVNLKTSRLNKNGRRYI